MKTGKIQVEDDSGKCTISWEYEGNKPVRNLKIESTSPLLRERVRQYLETPREYNMPQSQEIDDFVVVKNLPTDGNGFLHGALSTMKYATEISVLWDTFEE